MKSINIYAHAITCSCIEFETVKRFSCYESDYVNENHREKEESDLLSFINFMGYTGYDIYDCFYYNYSIPQISKEFDLLRIGENSVINIEIKSYSTIEKITNQLCRNKYYLSFLDKDMFLFCFETGTKKLYLLDENNKPAEVDKNVLIDMLKNQKNLYNEDINDCFKITNYLVSPFNKTQQFIEGKYFLKSQQEKVKKSIILDIVDITVNHIISLVGEAGTGKTLLAYDIAKTLMREGLKVCIIHSGLLNDGHIQLNGFYNWNIVSAKQSRFIKYDEVDVLIIDEGQRIYSNQLEEIIEIIRHKKIPLIFSNDPKQVLSDYEKNSKTYDLINKNKTREYILSGKIRTNIEITRFIDNLFNLRHNYPEQEYKNIHINYFENYCASKSFIEYLTNNGWNFINYTPCTYMNEDFEVLKEFQIGTSHNVIGQEYDKVACVVDHKFYYDNYLLKSSGWKSDKNGEMMLYQAMTRTRNELYLIFVGNIELFKRALKILSKNKND